MTSRDTTVVCVLTPAGRGAVAVVAVEGEKAVSSTARFFQAANRRPLDQQPIDRIVYGHWVSDERTDSEGEDLVVCRRSETWLEVHCHGGSQSSRQILSDLASVGCQSIDANEWLRSEYDCPIQSVARQALAEATTLRTGSILLDQYHGALRREIEAIFEDLEASNAESAKSRIEKLLQFGDLGLHLTKPWQVVIAGQPNVGKSSLINALVGFDRAIVFDQPGTTRDIVTATTAIDGWPVELSDTAGLHETDDTIESAGIELTRNRLAAADLIVWVLDARDLAANEEVADWELARRQAAEVGIELAEDQTLLVVNKCDLVEKVPRTSDSRVGTCAVSGAGIEQLLATIAKRLVPNSPAPGVAIPFTNEQLNALKTPITGHVGFHEIVAAIKSLIIQL